MKQPRTPATRILRNAHLAVRNLDVEWLTLGLFALVWIIFIVATWIIGSREAWFALPLLAPLVTLHSSLVHEAIHGHPTRNARVNEMLLTINPGLFIPFGAFRDSHQAHHESTDLTDPALDTESNFISSTQWDSLCPTRRRIRQFNASLVGRLITGPIYTLASFVKIEARRIAKNKATARVSWALHTAGCVAVIYWIVAVCGISLIAYVLLVAYPAMSLLTLRTYAEHNFAPDQSMRTAIVESSWPLSLLFLNNNLHAVHHQHPHVPWYRLPKVYAQCRHEFTSRENFFAGYREVFKRYAFKPYAPVIHPLHGPRHG